VKKRQGEKGARLRLTHHILLVHVQVEAADSIVQKVRKNRDDDLTIAKLIKLWNWFDLKVKSNQRKDKTLQILNEIIKDPEAFWVLALLNIQEGADLSAVKGDMIIS
jgi:hypothetical protein